MPKKQAQRRIDKTAGSGARTITITGGSTGGSGNVDQHALSGSKHTGTLAQNQAPWAVTDSEFSAHTTNANAHHARRHSVTSTSDHSITADAYAFLGATATDTLGLLYIASSGDGIDVTKSSQTFTFAVDVSDFDGAGLGDDGSNNLYVKTAEGVTLNGDNVTVDEAYDFAWTGDHTHASTVGSPSFSSGFAGSGWRIDTDDASLTLNDLTVRNRLSVYELLVRQIRATNGNVFVSDSAKVETVSGSGPYELSVASGDVHGFAVGDLIRAQRFTGSGVYQSNMQVTGVTDTVTFVATLTSGDAPAAGMDFVRLGSTTDSDRRGSIYLASADDDAPFIDIIDGVDAFGDWNTANVLKVRMGNLAGITDPDFGVLSGYGLYVKGGGYFKGDVGANNGSVFLGNNAVNIAAGTSNFSLDFESSLTFTTDPANPATSNTVAYVQGDTYDSSGTVVSAMTAKTIYGTTNLTDRGAAYFGVHDIASAYEFGYLKFTGENDVVSGEIVIQNHNGTNGTLTLDADVSMAGHFVPPADSVFDIGTATSRFRRLYVDEIVAGTTSSTDTGHNHDDRYYTQAQIDSQALGYAAASHTHASYINSATLTSTLADYVTSAGLTVTLADYYTEAEADALLANKSSTGHTHDDRYYTESEIDALLAGYSATGHTHDDRYYTESEVDALLAAGVTPDSHDVVSSHSVTAAQYSVLSTWGAADTLSMVTAVDDGTAGHKLLKTDADGDITITDLHAGAIIASDDVTIGDASLGWLFDVSAGQLKSRNFNAANPEAGILLDVTDGRIEALDISARSGRLRAAVFELDSTVVGPSSEMWTRKGGAMTADAVTVAASGSITVAVHDGGAGHFPQFEVGETIRLRGYATTALTQQVEGATYTPDFLVMFAPALERDRLLLADVYLEITDVSNQDTHYEYICDWLYGDDKIIFPEGTPVIGYGAATDGAPLGAMKIDADANGPRITAFQYGDEAWDETLIFAAGDISSVYGMDGDEIGVAASSDLTSSTAAAFVGSNKRLLLRNADFNITDEAGGTILAITNENGMQIASGTDNKSWIEMLTSDGEIYARMGSANIQPLGAILKSSQPGFVLESLYQDPRNIGIPDFWENGSGWGAGEFSSRMQMRSLDENNEIGASISTVISTISAFTETGFATWGQVDIAANDAIHLDAAEVVVRGDTTFWDSTAFYGDTDFVGLVGIGANSRWLWPSPPAEADVSSGYLYVDSNGFVKVKT